MNPVKNISIRRKQMLIIMLTSSVVLLLACAAFIANDVAAFHRELPEEVSVLADVLGNNLSAAIDFNDAKAANDTLAGLRADPDAVAACVYDRGGQVIATYKHNAGPPFFTPPPVQEAGYRFEDSELHMFRPILSQGEQIGNVG